MFFLLVRTLEIVEFLEVLRKEAGRNGRDSRFFAFGSSRSTVAKNTAVIPLAPLRSIEPAIQIHSAVVTSNRP